MNIFVSETCFVRQNDTPLNVHARCLLTQGINMILPLSESILNGSLVGGTSDTVADLFSSMPLRSKSAMLDCGSSEGSDALEKRDSRQKRKKQEELLAKSIT